MTAIRTKDPYLKKIPTWLQSLWHCLRPLEAELHWPTKDVHCSQSTEPASCKKMDVRTSDHPDHPHRSYLAAQDVTYSTQGCPIPGQATDPSTWLFFWPAGNERLGQSTEQSCHLICIHTTGQDVHCTSRPHNPSFRHQPCMAAASHPPSPTFPCYCHPFLSFLGLLLYRSIPDFPLYGWATTPFPPYQQLQHSSTTASSVPFPRSIHPQELPYPCRPMNGQYCKKPSRTSESGKW